METLALETLFCWSEFGVTEAFLTQPQPTPVKADLAKQEPHACVPDTAPNTKSPEVNQAKCTARPHKANQFIAKPRLLRPGHILKLLVNNPSAPLENKEPPPKTEPRGKSLVAKTALTSRATLPSSKPSSKSLGNLDKDLEFVKI